MITMLAALALTTTGAKADIGLSFMTGEVLNEYCEQVLLVTHQQNANQTEAGACYGYVLGVYDALSNAGLAKAICLPKEGAAEKTVVEVVARYLDEHPDQRQYSGQSLVHNALIYGYPCPE
jgi:hypothetical protein